MTGAQTDPVTTPKYTTAVSLLLRVAAPLFFAATKEAQGGRLLNPVLYSHYSVIRAAAQKMLDERAIGLGTEQGFLLVQALSAAHDTAHDLCIEPQPHLTECPCETAETVRILVGKLLQLEGAL